VTIMRSVRRWLGRILCRLGLHKWGPWKPSTRVLDVRFCQHAECVEFETRWVP
jgi:hypothetical protein